METSPNIALVRTFLDALKSLQVEQVLALTTPDVEYQNVPWPPDRGHAQFERTMRGFNRVLTEFDYRLHHVAETDGVVLTERTDVLKGPLLDMEFWVYGTFEVKDGKIAVWKDRFDLATVGAQLVVGPLKRLWERRGELTAALRRNV